MVGHKFVFEAVTISKILLTAANEQEHSNVRVDHGDHLTVSRAITQVPASIRVDTCSIRR